MAIVGSLVARGSTAWSRAERCSRRADDGGSLGRLRGYQRFGSACMNWEFSLCFSGCQRRCLTLPYSLHVAIPAMMIGHLTFAGLAEFFVSGGVVAYLQRTNPSLLEQNFRQARG
jgi:cobalt/nickel transport system permease protein